MRTMVSFALAAAAICMGAASARLLPSTCTSLEANAASLEYDMAVPCYRGSASGGAVVLNFTVTPTMLDDSDVVTMMMWNIDQADSATFSVGGADWLKAMNLPVDSGITAAVDGLQAEGGAQTAFIVTRHQINCAGAYSIMFSNVNGNYGIAVYGGPSTPMRQTLSFDGTDDAPTTATGSYIEGNSDPTFALKGAFTMNRFAIASFELNATGDSLDSGSSFDNFGGPANTATTRFAAADNILMGTWEEVERPSATEREDGLTFSVDPAAVSAVYYNWASLGPIMEVNVTVVGQEMYPTMSLSSPMAQVTIPSDKSSAVIMIEGPLPTNWVSIDTDGNSDGVTQTVTMTSNTGEDMGMGSPPDYGCMTNPNDPQTDFANTCENNMLSLSDPIDFVDNLVLVPRTFDEPTYAYIRIERSSCHTASSGAVGITEDPILNINVTFTYHELQGECMDYTDCYVGADDHPSLRTSFSSTGNNQRMLQCVAMPSLADATVPESRCMECSADCDCPGGSYCHTDNGVCEDSLGNPYVCDSVSHRQAGVCRTKDPSKEIIGKACRADDGTVYESSSSTTRRIANGAGSVLVISEGNRDDRSDGPTGGGFCGEARYYNASNVDGIRNNIALAGVARTILWEGQCVMGICQECSDGATTCTGTGGGGDKTCIRGKWRDTIIVDQTIRTFTSNTVAGTALAGVMMIIVVQILFVVYFVVERGDVSRKEEEKKEQEQKAKAEEKAEQARKKLATGDKAPDAGASGGKKGAGASESKTD